MALKRYKIVESSGRRTEGVFNVTGAEGAGATIAAGFIDGSKTLTVHRGRRGLLYALRMPGSTTVRGDTGFVEVTDNDVPAGSGKDVYGIPLLAQSDGAGRATAGNAALDDPDASVASRCKLFDHSGDWGAAVEPASSTTNIIHNILTDSAPTSSPMTRLLSKLALADPNHEYVGIPCCKGATSSADWAGGVAAPTTATLLGASIHRVLTCARLFATRNFKIPFIAVGQVTTNGSSSALAAQWDEDWASIMAALETALAGLYLGGSLRAVAWKAQATQPSGLGYAGADWTALRASQDAWVTATRKLAQMPDGNLLADNIHLNATGLITLGDATGQVAIDQGWL